MKNKYLINLKTADFSCFSEDELNLWIIGLKSVVEKIKSKSEISYPFFLNY